MTGPEHYKEAERILSSVCCEPDDDLHRGEVLLMGDHRDVLALAQVHATLALTTATGSGSTTRRRRRVQVLAIGDSAAELEFAALAEAREFFSADLRLDRPDQRLEIVDDYIALPGSATNPIAKVRAGGRENPFPVPKRFYAHVMVGTVEA